MHSLEFRRGPLLGGVVGAAVLLTASAAFACTSTAGRIAITGSNGATGSATYQGNGTDSFDPSLGYCVAPSRVTLQNSNASKLDFDLAVSRLGCKTGTNDDLPVRTYEVRWVKSPDAMVVDGSCHRDRVDVSGIKVRQWIPLGNISVTSSTTTTKPFSLNGLVGTEVDYFRGPGNICLAVPENEIEENKASPIVFMRWNVI